VAFRANTTKHYYFTNHKMSVQPTMKTGLQRCFGIERCFCFFIIA